MTSKKIGIALIGLVIIVGAIAAFGMTFRANTAPTSGYNCTVIGQFKDGTHETCTNGQWSYTCVIDNVNNVCTAPKKGA